MNVKIFSAGSLRGILPVLLEKAGIEAKLELGPSGVLKERIVSGERPDLFFPASMNHAIDLAAQDLSSNPQVFAHNELCLFGRSQSLKGHDALSAMLDPKMRLGTSTPIDDPGGDYAFAVLDKANTLIPGATDILKQKALTLVGGRNSKIGEGNHSPVYVLFKEYIVDMFLGYRTTAINMVSLMDDIIVVELPKELQVKVEYGVVVIGMSIQGQRALNLLMTPEFKQLLSFWSGSTKTT